MNKTAFMDRLSDTTQLSDACRVAILNHLTVKTVGEETRFKPQTGDNRELILILSGIARVFAVTHDGKDVTQYFVRAEDFLTANLQQFRADIEGIEAITELTYVSLKFSTFEKLMVSFPELTNFYVSLLNEISMRSRERMERRARSGDFETYENFLLAHPGIELQVPTAHIASYLGLSTSEFMRARQRYRDRGIM